MEHALRLNLSAGLGGGGGAFPAAPKFLDPLAQPTLPFTSPAWSRPLKPRAIALLDVFKNHELLTTYTVDQKPVYLIGRNAVVCDIVLNHCSISRLHATIIHHKDGAAYLVDLGSCHGTFVDDMRLKPLQPTLIPHGSTLKFGASSRSYSFKSFESREQILERVSSRIELEPEEMEVEQNTLLNRALSYRLGFSIPHTHKNTDEEGDDPMAALPPARQMEVSTSAATLIRRTQSEDSTNTGVFSLGPLGGANPAEPHGATEFGRKRTRAQSAGLPLNAGETGSPQHLQEILAEEEDGNSKRVHFSERLAETIPARAAYCSPEHTPSNASSATSSPPPQKVPESEQLLVLACRPSKASESIDARRSLSPPPPVLRLNLSLSRDESCSSSSSGGGPAPATASHEVAS